MTNPPSPQIWPGRHVTLELTYGPGDVERLELDVVPDDYADFERGFLGESTPLAKAISGHHAGDVVHYRASDGPQIRVSILAVERELRNPPKDLSARREETIRKAVKDSQDTDAILFASSFSGKWGDYDPNAVPKDDEDGEDSEEPKP